MRCVEALLELSPKSKAETQARANILEKSRNRKIELMKDEDFLFKKARSLNEEGKRKDALRLLTLISRVDPGNENAQMGMAEVLVEDGKFERAIKRYTTVLNINPNNERALMAKGILYMELGYHKNALMCFDIMLRINPKNHIAKGYKDECLEKIEEGVNGTR
jgi:tetratricopeptide (TPR) repeat protein